jgi:phosphoglycolate phosphatase-like HAD superfamily hydrolase
MKIFISYSGNESRRIGQHLRSWLPLVLPYAKPWMAEHDLAPGTRWNPELARNLDQSATGIICVTPDNKQSSWLLFEAGALSRTFANQTDERRVFPLLFGVDNSDLHPSPLAQFQAVELKVDSAAAMLEFVRNLNTCAEPNERLPDEVVAVMFEHYWPHLKSHVFGGGKLVYSSGDTLRLFEVDLQYFLRSIDGSKVDGVDITAHTGENLVKAFAATLSEDTDQAKILRHSLLERRVPIRILYRDPESETSARRTGIDRTAHRVAKLRRRGFKIQARGYQHLPVFCSVIVRSGTEPGPKRRQGVISYYHFPGGHPSQRATKGFLVDENPGETSLMADIVDSWFEHMWGKSFDAKLHTIVFDFDDTIVNSHASQIEAWVDTLKEAIAKYGIHTAQLRLESLGGITQTDPPQVADEQALRESIGRIFFEHCSAKAILDALFQDLPEVVQQSLHELRYQKRVERMASTRLFDGAPEVLRGLCRRYNLAIISATDEELIKNYLSEPERVPGGPLYPVFQHIFGKREATFNWRNVDRKSQLLHKVGDITGVPARRMVYVGDNAGDYNASKALGIPFVEARLFSDELKSAIGRVSLVVPQRPPMGTDKSPPYFTEWGKLGEVLEQLEAELDRPEWAPGTPQE